MEDLDDQIESVKANINYLHENIVDCQQNIVQMEQAVGGVQEEDQAEDEVFKIVNVQTLQLDEVTIVLYNLPHFPISFISLILQFSNFPLIPLNNFQFLYFPAFSRPATCWRSC